MANTNMTNPPTTETKMVDAKKTEKMVELVALQDISMRVEGKKVRIQKGSKFSATKEDAEWLTKTSKGYYSFSGERHGEDSEAKHLHARARMVQNPSA